MKGVMRMLMMFGPMIYRQYNKYKSRKEATQNHERQEQKHQSSGGQEYID